MAAFVYNARLHWALASGVLFIDICIVALTLFVDKAYPLEPPEDGDTNMTAPIGWLGACGAVFIFGCYGILIKTPSVREVKCDCMVFQCYFSFAVAAASMLIWLAAGSGHGLTFNGSSFSMGVLFATLWIISQVLAYNSISTIGYAISPVIINGLTVCTSFVWGFAIFNNPVHSWLGAVSALVLMIGGMSLASASSVISDRQARCSALKPAQDIVQTDTEASGQKGGEAGKIVFGITCGCLSALCNGSLMVSLACFQNGCTAIRVQAYEGSALAPLAFLPSMVAGILVTQPMLFFLYWGRSMLAGRMPQFHFSKVAVPGILTGAFWGMGFFNAMFATIYLGQTVGFPVTQCCLIPMGLWGILYYREIQGAAAICIFVLASLKILGGATLAGMSC